VLDPDSGDGLDGATPLLDIAVGSCVGPTTVHRLTSVHIPTLADASEGSGAPLGHDIDGVDNSACDVMDFAGGVDNAFLDVAAALPNLSPDQPVNLQDAIDAALRCPAGSATCAPLALDLNVTANAGAGCGEITFVDGDGAAVSTTGAGALTADGSLRVELESFEFTIPYPTPNGPVLIPLRMREVIVTATVRDGSVSDILIGGSLQKGEFEATARAILPLISAGIVNFEDIAPILADLYDVDIGGSCTGLSVGLMAQAL
jgi:hypothetical protein